MSGAILTISFGTRTELKTRAYIAAKRSKYIGTIFHIYGTVSAERRRLVKICDVFRYIMELCSIFLLAPIRSARIPKRLPAMRLRAEGRAFAAGA